MLRRAVIKHLMNVIPSLGGRVYQAFLAPPNAERPYATVKISAPRGSPSISYAGDQPVEVRIYDEPASFIVLDNIETAVIDALHGVDIADLDTGEKYHLRWRPDGGIDYDDEERKLICRLIFFEAALLIEPGGGNPEGS